MGWFFLLSIEGLAVCWDLLQDRIPNFLIVSGFLLGFSWQLSSRELIGIRIFLTGSLTALLILGLLHSFRMLGAGDIKLFMVAGAFLGPADLIKLICYSFLIAAAISLVVILKHRILMHRLTYFFQYVQRFYKTGKWEPYIQREKNAAYLHFSVPIFLGSILLMGGF